jgi:hypothetical protein
MIYCVHACSGASIDCEAQGAAAAANKGVLFVRARAHLLQWHNIPTDGNTVCCYVSTTLLLQVFEVDEEVANESVTIKNMIEGVCVWRGGVRFFAVV